MARLNIEDDFWDDAASLILALGDRDKAYGMALRFFRECQKLFKRGRPMTQEEFDAEGFSESLFPKFARRVPGGISAAGAEKHFAWLEKKSEAGKVGGRVSAKRPRDENGRLLSKHSQADSKHEPSETKHSQASSSSSPSYNTKNTTTTTVGKAGEEVREAFEVWNQTLEHFGLPRTRMAMPQEASLVRAIRALGFENVVLALEGARYEPPCDRFKPQEHLSIDRTLHRDSKGVSRWEKFKNLALARHAERDRRRQAERDAEARA